MAARLCHDTRGLIAEYVCNPYQLALVSKEWRLAVDQRLYLHLFERCAKEEALIPYAEQAKQKHGKCVPKCFRHLIEQIRVECEAILGETTTWRKLRPPYVPVLTDRAAWIAAQRVHGFIYFFNCICSSFALTKGKYLRLDLAKHPTARETTMCIEEAAHRLTTMAKERLGRSFVMDCLEVRVLPSEIGLFQNLTSINLRQNHFVSLPDTLGNLSKLEFLNLNENQFETFPSPVLRLKALRELRLARNRLQDIPDEIACLTSLTSLDVSGNQLRTLPDCVASIIHRDLSNNPLEQRHFRPAPPILRAPHPAPPAPAEEKKVVKRATEPLEMPVESSNAGRIKKESSCIYESLCWLYSCGAFLIDQIVRAVSGLVSWLKSIFS